MNKKYDNKELANAYFEVVRLPDHLKKRYGYIFNDNYRKIKELIANCPIDMAFLYQEFRSLKELHVKGIGKNTKEILEKILEKGENSIEELKKKTQSERERKYIKMMEMDRSISRYEQLIRNKIEMEERETKRESDEQALDLLINGCEND